MLQAWPNKASKPDQNAMRSPLGDHTGTLAAGYRGAVGCVS